MSFDTRITLRLRVHLLQVHDDGEDLVVRLAVGERRRQHGVVIASVCRKSRPGAAPPDLASSAMPSAMPFRHRGDELVEEARYLARVARDLGHALLVVVELLEREDREVDVVLLEPEEARGIVHQHVGVEHEELVAVRGSRVAGPGLPALRRTCGRRG